ncbi:MAG: response regulator transcription factor, partial [Myxococcota bacterium]
MRILIVEDEVRVRSFLRRGLCEAGMSVDVAADGGEGLERALESDYDAIVLDLMLPTRDGFEVLRMLRAGGCATPVLILTARDAVEDRVRGLDGGADDYLAKPFAFAELLARVRALMRRGTTQARRIRVGDLEIDLASRTVARAGQRLELTPKEYSLLEYLARHAGEVVTRTMIAEHVWSIDF